MVRRTSQAARLRAGLPGLHDAEPLTPWQARATIKGTQGHSPRTHNPEQQRPSPRPQPPAPPLADLYGPAYAP